MKKPARRIKVEVGSGNIFADLGLPDAEELLLKSQIVVQLRRLIDERKLTQTQAAKRIGIGQPDLSNVLRGRFHGYSVERLMRCSPPSIRTWRSPYGRTAKRREKPGRSRSKRRSCRQIDRQRIKMLVDVE